MSSKKSFLILSLIVVDLVVSGGQLSAAISSNGTGGGDWNTDTTWTGGVVPTETDDVIIQGSDVVTLTAAGSCANLTMDAGTKLTITAGGPIPGSSWSLDPASTIEFNTIVPNSWGNPTFGNLIFDIPNYSLHPNTSIIVAGNLSILNNTLRGIGTVSGTNVHNIAGNVNISGTGRITAVNQSNPTTASCTWNIGGNLTLGSTLNRMQLYESAGPHTGSAVFNINGDLTVGQTSLIMLKSTAPSTEDYPEGIINLKGNFVNNGNINVNNATSGTSPGLSINFVGTSPQDWSGTGKFSVTVFSVNMNINNPAGVTLSIPQDISTRTVVILTNGKLTTTSTNLLRIMENGSLIGGSSSSYINGPLAKRIISGLQNPVFPIGDATKYTPVNLEFGGDVNEGTITVSTTPGIHPQIAASGLNSSKTLNRYYTVTNTIAIFDNVTATFNFDPTDVIGGADPTKYVVKKFDTETWTTPTTANPLATSIQATSVTSFSDFAVGQLPQVTISGRVTEPDTNIPVEGVSIDANNGGSSDTTDVNGYYEVVVDYNWSGTVTPTKYAYGFEPNSRSYTNVIADQNGQDYTGRLLTFAISGYIRNDCDVPIPGVLVDANAGGGEAITDVNGFYEVWVDYNWSGTVTPGKAHYTFDPTNKAYTDVLENKTDQDYETTNIYDLDCDGSIGFGDIAVMSDNWLSDDVDIHSGDFNDDDIVNFLDFTDFAGVWQD